MYVIALYNQDIDDLPDVYDEEGNEIDVRETVLPSNIVKEKNEQSKSDDKK